MRDNVIKLEQIKQAKRLFKAYEITGDDGDRLTMKDFVEKVIEMDRQSDLELAEYLEAQKQKRG